MVPARGAQAFGSAQSYALKQFMRSLFQIPTGDKEDADFAVPASLPQTVKRGTARRGNGKTAATKNGTRMPAKTVKAKSVPERRNGAEASRQAVAESGPEAR
jgi:hypothetical protein